MTGERRTLKMEFGTGLMHTKVYVLAPARFEWDRTAGTSATGPLRRGSDDLVALVPTDSGAPIDFVLAGGTTEPLTYPLPGPISVGRMIYAATDPRIAALLETLLRAAGVALRTLHARPVAGAATTVPAPYRRLDRWLRTGDGPGDAGLLHEHALRTLGEPALTRLHEWYRELTATGSVLLHGCPTLGALVPPVRTGKAGWITGEDLAVGDPALDLGWILGELTEFAECARRGLGSVPAIDFDALARAFSDGYGRAPTPAVHRAAVLRICLHMHDFAAYVGWNDEMLGYLAMIGDLTGAGAALDKTSA